MFGPLPNTTQSGNFSRAVRSAKIACRNAFGCAFFAAVFSVPAQAQVVDDGTYGGTARRDIERSLPTPSLPEVSPKPGAAQPQAPKIKGDTLIVSRFRFVGNTLISDAALTRAVTPYVGRPIDFDELQNAAAMASLVYRDRGYVATISIPKQEIDDGIVTLKVAEARYGGARLDPSSDGRIHSELILERIEHAMRVEKAVNTNVVDRALLLINDLPGASVQGGLAEGQVDGETDVVLKSSRKPVLVGSLLIDNHGALATGSQRHLVDVALNSPTGRGEQYTASLMQTEGTRYGRAGVSMPVGLDGARAGINASYLDYQVIAGTQVQSNLTGESASVAGDVSYPLLRSRQANLYVSGSLVAKWFDNYAFQRLSRSYETQVATASLTGNWFDSLFGGGSNQVSLSYGMGHMNLKDSTSEATDAATTKTEGAFEKFNASLSRAQVLGDGWTLNSSVSLQIASRNLDSSEKFYLGGANGLRAYPSSEGGGSAGELYQLELRKRVRDNVEIRFFRDEGRVRQTIESYAGNPTPNILHYGGAGAAAIISLPYNFTLTLVWSQRVSVNPFPNIVTDKDQDGTLQEKRIWASLSKSF